MDEIKDESTMNKYEKSIYHLETLKNGVLDSYYARFNSMYQPFMEDINTIKTLLNNYTKLADIEYEYEKKYRESKAYTILNISLILLVLIMGIITTKWGK